MCDLICDLRSPAQAWSNCNHKSQITNHKSQITSEEAPMLGGRPWDEWIAQYGHSHRHPFNRFCHTVGIPLIVLSLLLFLVALAVAELWWPAVALFVAGWVLQFLGH